jgi:hypothetical protein
VRLGGVLGYDQLLGDLAVGQANATSARTSRSRSVSWPRAADAVEAGGLVSANRWISRRVPTQVEGKANSAFQLFDKASSQTARYGFPKGVCGAGES